VYPLHVEGLYDRETKFLVCYELSSTDVAAAKTLYGNEVGWNVQDVPMPGMTYSLLFAGTTQVGGMMAMPEGALMPGERA
jgi:uncharacterized protein